MWNPLQVAKRLRGTVLAFALTIPLPAPGSPVDVRTVPSVSCKRLIIDASCDSEIVVRLDGTMLLMEDPHQLFKDFPLKSEVKPLLLQQYREARAAFREGNLPIFAARLSTIAQFQLKLVHEVSSDFSSLRSGLHSNLQEVVGTDGVRGLERLFVAGTDFHKLTGIPDDLADLLNGAASDYREQLEATSRAAAAAIEALEAIQGIIRRYAPQRTAEISVLFRPQLLELATLILDGRGLHYQEEFREENGEKHRRFVLVPDKSTMGFPVGRALMKKGIRLILDIDETGSAGGHFSRDKKELVVGIGFVLKRVSGILLHELKHFAFDLARKNGEDVILSGSIAIHSARALPGETSVPKGKFLHRAYREGYWFEELSTHSRDLMDDWAELARLPEDASLAARSRGALGIRQKAGDIQNFCESTIDTMQAARSALRGLRRHLMNPSDPLVWGILSVAAAEEAPNIITEAPRNLEFPALHTTQMRKEQTPEIMLGFEPGERDSSPAETRLSLFFGPYQLTLNFGDPALLPHLNQVLMKATLSGDSPVRRDSSLLALLDAFDQRSRRIEAIARTAKGELKTVWDRAQGYLVDSSPENKERLRVAMRSFHPPTIFPPE